MSRRLVIPSVVVLLLAAVSWAVAEEPPKVDPAAEMAKYADLAKPGPMHAKLAQSVGRYDVVVRSWWEPGGKADESKGTSERTMLLGGRYLQETFESAMNFVPGQPPIPFSGIGTTAYDTITKKWISTWIDTMSTGIMVMEGASGEGGSIVYHGTMTDPSGTVAKTRSVVRPLGPGREVMEMFMQLPDGSEFKTMEITYTKK